jgi:dephospho-CoA kinase
MIIGLTGGMGCGKSTAARIFEELGCTRLDSDALVRDKILLDPEVEQAAVARFGPAVLDAEGRINRAALAREIFSDDARLAAWEDLIHPRLYALWRAAIDAAPDRAWLIEVPLLHEKQLEKWFDFIVCVTTTSARQYARLHERGLSQALAEARISKQLPLAKKIELADFVLSNDGSMSFLRDQIAYLVNRLGLTR